MTTKSTEAPLAGDASEDTKSSEAYPGEAFYRREARLKHALDEATRRREAYVQGFAQGVAEGVAQGRAEVRSWYISPIRTLLTKRFGSVDAAIEEALTGKTDLGELERLLPVAATCGSLDEFKASL